MGCARLPSNCTCYPSFLTAPCMYCSPVCADCRCQCPCRCHARRHGGQQRQQLLEQQAIRAPALARLRHSEAEGAPVPRCGGASGAIQSALPARVRWTVHCCTADQGPWRQRSMLAMSGSTWCTQSWRCPDSLSCCIALTGCPPAKGGKRLALCTGLPMALNVCRFPVYPAKAVAVEVGHSLSTMRPLGPPQEMATCSELQRFPLPPGPSSCAIGMLGSLVLPIWHTTARLHM